MIKIYPPFTQDQVRRLNAFQLSGSSLVMICGNRHGRLRVRESGWYCKKCSFTQSWAYSFMAAEKWERRVAARFTCPACGASSSHPQDISNNYCGACHKFFATGPTPSWIPAAVQSVSDVVELPEQDVLGDAVQGDTQTQPEHPQGQE